VIIIIWENDSKGIGNELLKNNYGEVLLEVDIGKAFLKLCISLREQLKTYMTW
jgi:hypothetical protein